MSKTMMGAVIVQMNVTLLKNNNRIVSLVCAAMLFLAILNLPIEYYWVLRITIFAGCILVIVENLKTIHWLLIFILIALLFNPILPVYLIQKSVWIPLDIVCGILFIIEALKQQKSKEDPDILAAKTEKTYRRDKTHQSNN